MGVDLAISTKARADYTAVVTSATDKETGNVYVIDAVRKKCEFPEIIKLIVARAALLMPKQIRIEEIQFQAAVTQELLRTTKLPVKGFRPEKDKYTRFLPLVSRYERKMVFHSATLPKDFEEEILSFTGEDDEHDDYVDAFSSSYSGNKIRSFGVRSEGRLELADLVGYVT